MAKAAELSQDIRTVEHFHGTRASLTPSVRLEEVRKAARKFRENMLSGSRVSYFKSVPLVDVPYPTRYAFFSAFNDVTLVTPIIHITNRLFIIQFETADGVKTLLFSPSDIMANAETRFFKRFGGGFLTKMEGDGMRVVKDTAQKFIAPIHHTVEDALREIGLSPEKVDYISYDHLHTQDVRNWLGSRGSRGYFPNAKLLIMKEEWESARGLVAPQKDWYCPGGIDGLDEARVIQLDGDIMLGEGVALLRTPGHTMGNHSLVVHTDQGLLVSSENGVAAECYAPQNSRINEIREYAQKTGMEVILNGNTQESGLEQYISMVMEKEVAGKSLLDGDYPNVFNSSQFSPYWMFPGIAPSFRFPDMEFGSLKR